MSTEQLLITGISACVVVITTLAGVVRHLWKELRRRENQLIEFAQGVGNGSKETLNQIAAIIEKQKSKRSGK